MNNDGKVAVFFTICQRLLPNGILDFRMASSNDIFKLTLTSISVPSPLSFVLSY